MTTHLLTPVRMSKYIATSNGTRVATIVKTKKDYFQVAPSRKHFADIAEWMSELSAANPDVKFSIATPAPKPKPEPKPAGQLTRTEWATLPAHIRRIHTAYDFLNIPDHPNTAYPKNTRWIAAYNSATKSIEKIHYNRLTNTATWASGAVISDLDKDARIYRDSDTGVASNFEDPGKGKHLVYIEYPANDAVRARRQKQADALNAAGYECIWAPVSQNSTVSPHYTWNCADDSSYLFKDPTVDSFSSCKGPWKQVHHIVEIIKQLAAATK